MKLDDVIRKVRLLRKVTLENGASEAEAESAARLASRLMERFAVAPEDVRPVPPQRRRSWVYWEQLLGEYGLRLNRFGGFASASLGHGVLLNIKLASGQWCVRRASALGWQTAICDTGLESLRAYLEKNGPRNYSLGRQRYDTSAAAG